MPAERRTEGARRAVAHAFGNFVDPHFLPTQQSFGDCHAPCEQIFLRRHADGACETIEEDGARQRSLASELELADFNVRVKLVEPGYGPSTRFTENGGSRMRGLIPEAYAPFAERIFAAFAKPAAVTKESDVAEVVWQAANDSSGRLRFAAGADAVALAQKPLSFPY